MRVLGILGSLREQSYNLMPLRAARKVGPEGMEIAVADLRAIPLLNQDERAQRNPAAVEKPKALTDTATGDYIASLLSLQALKARLG